MESQTRNREQYRGGNPTPEPETLSLLGAGIAILGAFRLRRRVTWLLSACVLAVYPSIGSASVILSNTAGTNMLVHPAFSGESFTTPSGPSYNNIGFNFFSDVPPTTPLAAGILYLFTSAYTGTPTGLSGAGAVAHSTSVSSGEYLFDPSVTLLPSTQYFVYEDTAITPTGGNLASGDLSYLTFSSSANFGVNGGAHGALFLHNFQLSGTAVAATATPEPMSLALVIPAMAGLLLFARRAQRAVRLPTVQTRD